MFCLKDRIRLSQIILSVAFFALISTAATAQTRGKVTEVKDSRIDTLLALRLALSKSSNNPTLNAAGVGEGYRVQFFIGSTRSEAYDAQSKFNQLYPGIKTYVIYNAPNFKVRAGDFRNKLEATGLMQQLRSQFSSLFIITEKINLPKLDNQ